MQPGSKVEAIRITNRAAAMSLVAEVMTTMEALEAVLAEESAHVRVGRLREGLSQAERKTALAAAYVRGLETAKSNAIALARFVPEGIETLKAAHQRFAAVVETNQIVLSTAKSVSEGLVKSVADELGRARNPALYGMPSATPSPYGQSGRSGPLVLSRSL
jgi:phage terminase large subunit-like protein